MTALGRADMRILIVSIVYSLLENVLTAIYGYMRTRNDYLHIRKVARVVCDRYLCIITALYSCLLE